MVPSTATCPPDGSFALAFSGKRTIVHLSIVSTGASNRMDGAAVRELMVAIFSRSVLATSRSAPSQHVKLDPIEDRVVTNRACVGRAVAERLAIGLAGATHVLVTDGVEREQVDGVHLDPGTANRIHATDSHLWPLPQSKRD